MYVAHWWFFFGMPTLRLMLLTAFDQNCNRITANDHAERADTWRISRAGDPRPLGANPRGVSGALQWARASRLGRVQISRRDPLRQHSRLGRIVFVTAEPPSSARISALRASFSAFVGMRLLKTLG
jgi:hypothetical protein